MHKIVYFYNWFLVKASTLYEEVSVFIPTLVTKAYCYKILICFRPNLIIIFFQDFSAFRLDNLHSAHDNIFNLAGVLLRPKVQVHQNKRQTHG